MSTLEILAVVTLVVLVVSAALLAAAETSFTRLSQARAGVLQEQDDHPRSRLVRRLLEQRERILNPILFLLLACHLAAATIVGAAAYERWGAQGAAIAFAVELVLIYVVAEAIPKTVALADPGRVATRLAPLVRALSLFAPLRWITDALLAISRVVVPARARRSARVSESELLAITSEAVASQAIEAEEQVLIESVITFGDTTARGVMVPRPDMVTVDAGFVAHDVLEIVAFNGFSRLPVTGIDIDDVVGVVHTKDLLRAELDGRSDHAVRAIMRDAMFVPETKRTASLLREMQSSMVHLAIVVDEYGGTAGLVTLEDLIEELVGDIVDEFDVEEPRIESLEDGRIRVDGRTSILDLESELEDNLPPGEWSTVGGLIVTTLGHLPDVGERVEAAGYTLEVERVAGRRIDRVLVSGPSD